MEMSLKKSAIVADFVEKNIGLKYMMLDRLRSDWSISLDMATGLNTHCGQKISFCRLN